MNIKNLTIAFLMLSLAGCQPFKEEQTVILKEGNFNESVAQGIVLVDFWAPWCTPCNMMEPVIEELSTEYDGKVTVGKVNIDEEAALKDRFKVSAIPALFFFKDGKHQFTLEGLQEKEAVVEKLNSLLEGQSPD